MVKITVEMVRRKAEHHDCLLAPLEEISLHQENIEKIEHIQDWCPKLQILLMQSNLISKIENLNKLKHLTYINLALNNIEIIENLERCESLNKLDLTLNFIGEIVSVESLTGNYNLQSIYLTGNPCTDYDNYRCFVIGTLPQLNSLDGRDIKLSERITCLQNLPIIRSDILFEQENYKYQRQSQKTRLQKSIQNKWENEYKDMDPDERNKKFWSEKCEHAPEVRHEIEHMRQLKAKSEQKLEEKEAKRQYKLFNDDGRPFNINQPKIEFVFNDSEPDKFIVDLYIYKYMDTSLIDIDVQPNYVRVLIKGKIFQLHLPENVNVSNSTAVRSQTTGHMVITMPKSNYVLQKSAPTNKTTSEEGTSSISSSKSFKVQSNTKREYLEIGPPVDVLDFTKMTRSKSSKYVRPKLTINSKPPSQGFIDNTEVPDLV